MLKRAYEYPVDLQTCQRALNHMSHIVCKKLRDPEYHFPLKHFNLSTFQLPLLNYPSIDVSLPP
jgi:hypothetical protein